LVQQLKIAELPKIQKTKTKKED